MKNDLAMICADTPKPKEIKARARSPALISRLPEKYSNNGAPHASLRRPPPLATTE